MSINEKETIQIIYSFIPLNEGNSSSEKSSSPVRSTGASGDSRWLLIKNTVYIYIYIYGF